MDQLTWLPSNLAEQLRQVVPKSPSALAAIELCENLLGEYWESGVDMPPMFFIFIFFFFLYHSYLQ